VIRSLVQQRPIDLIIDAGDITHHGSEPENQFVQAIGGFCIPYVFVWGNHDSVGTEAAPCTAGNLQRGSALGLDRVVARFRNPVHVTIRHGSRARPDSARTPGRDRDARVVAFTAPAAGRRPRG